jgi:hypothetical protein
MPGFSGVMPTIVICSSKAEDPFDLEVSACATFKSIFDSDLKPGQQHGRGRGETILLGSVDLVDHDNSVSGVPFLFRLPIIGSLSEVRSRAHNRTELLVLVALTGRSAGPPTRCATASRSSP